MSISVPRSEPVTPAEPLPGTNTIPALHEGDRLTRDEFERRYDAMPHLKKAELIEGVVHVPSPVRSDYHGEPHATLGGWLYHYRWKTPGVRVADNASVRLDMGNMPQPDCLMFIPADSGGQAHVDQDGYVNGAPEFIAEVTASSAAYDLHGKLELTSGTRFANTWSGASSTARSIGLCFATKAINGLIQRTMGHCGVPCFPVSGSTQRRLFLTISTL